MLQKTSEEVVRECRKIISENICVDDLQDHLMLRADLNADSLDFMSVVNDLERAFDIDIAMDEVRNKAGDGAEDMSIGDLITLVQKKINERSQVTA